MASVLQGDPQMMRKLGHRAVGVVLSDGEVTPGSYIGPELPHITT